MSTPHKPGLLICNFGGPQGPEELEPFLVELLSDVLPGPGWFKRALGARLGPLRARKVRENYEAIGWSPLVPETLAQLEGVRERLGPDAPPMAAGMMFTAPTMADGVRDLVREGCDAIVALGLYPHWSFATSGSAYDMVHDAVRDIRPGLPVHFARPFFDDPGYVAAVAATIRRAADALPGEGPIHLLFSAHGLPVSLIRKGDPYPDHVQATVRAVVRALDWTDPYDLSWQSRVGPVRWLAPSTVDAVETLAHAGVRRLLLVPVSFVGEHIETLHELDLEVAEDARKAGIPHVGRAAALGHEPLFLDALADLAREALADLRGARCVRCLIPKDAAWKREKTCPSCGFVKPRHITERAGPS